MNGDQKGAVNLSRCRSQSKARGELKKKTNWRQPIQIQEMIQTRFKLVKSEECQKREKAAKVETQVGEPRDGGATKPNRWEERR